MLTCSPGAFRRSSAHQKSFQHVEARDASADEAYWESMGNVISEDELKLWDAAESTLTQYQWVSSMHSHTKQTSLCFLNKLFSLLCSQCGPDRDLWARPWDRRSWAAEQRAAADAATVAYLRLMSLCLSLCLFFGCAHWFQIFSAVVGHPLRRVVTCII